MSQLIPCPSCGRHVRRTESACPFCAASVSFEHVPTRPMPSVRLGRAAIFAFGATVATLRPPDLREVVFEIIPRKVMVDASEAPAIIAEARACQHWAYRLLDSLAAWIGDHVLASLAMFYVALVAPLVVLVVALALLPSAVSPVHQMPGATTTPARDLAPTLTRARNDPRSLNTRTMAPSGMPRKEASSGWMSRRGSRATALRELMLAKLEFKKTCSGGLTSCSGYRAARSGLSRGSSCGGTNRGWCSGDPQRSHLPSGVPKPPWANGV